MSYQSEAQLKKNMLAHLIKQGYAFVKLPDYESLVQVELKRRGLDFKEAFNQIERYRKHS